MNFIISKKISSYHLWSGFLLILVFLSSFYGAVNWGHIGQIIAPDEMQRMLVPNYIFNYHRLPYGTEESVRIQLWGFSYAMQPYFPSILASLFMGIGDVLNSPITNYSPTGLSRLDVHLWARLVSVFAGTATVFLALKIGKRVFKKENTVILFAALTGLIPQFIYLSSYFNNDIFSVFTTYLIVYAWLRGRDSGWEWKDCILLSVALAMCLLTYYFAYAFVIGSVIIFNVIMYSKKSRKSREWIKKELFIIGLVFLLAGWFFIWNYIKFNDFIGLKTTAYYGEMFGSTSPPLKPSLRLTPENLKQSLSEMLFTPHPTSEWSEGRNWFNLSWTSFLGNFGLMQVPLSNITYMIYSVLISIGFSFGTLKSIYRSYKSSLVNNVFRIILILCMVLPILFSIYFSYTSDFQPQGRYIVSMTLPLMLCTAYGYELIDSKFKYTTSIVTMLLVLIFILIFFTVMLPNLA